MLEFSLDQYIFCKLNYYSSTFQSVFIDNICLREKMRMEQRLISRKREVVKRENEKGEEKKVDFSGMGLDSFPSLSLNPASITKLDLSNNNLQAIPESLTARLVNVMILDVHSNQLKVLPNSIGCLSKLKHLNVSSNLLESLPRTIENCRSLEDLIANFNNLISLPDTIGFELTSIVRLSVNSNKLCFLPPSTSHMLTLRSLDAHLNCLRSLPDDLENLTQLESLNISQNFQYLTSLPYSLGLLSSLSTLDISYNSITSLPDSIGCLAHLKVLKVEGNPLVCPPKKVRDLGIEAVRVYLRERMNKAETKKTSVIGRFVSCSVVKGGVLVGDQELLMDKHKLVQGFATPTREARSPMWMLSPKRLFGSPRK